MGRFVCAMVAAVGLWLIAPPESARAESFEGYVCLVSVDPASGFFTARIYSSPTCTGTSAVYGARGPTDEPRYLAIVNAMMTAAGARMRVSGSYTSGVFGIRLLDSLVFTAD